MVRTLFTFCFVVLCLSAQSSGTKVPIIFNTTYTCGNGQAYLQILSCSGKGGADEQCSVQYLNAAAPDGKGARVDLYRSMLNGDNSLRGCTLPEGTPVPAEEAPKVAPAVAARPAIAAVRTATENCAGALQPGAALEAQWRTSWYPATLVKCQNGQYLVRYSLDKSEELVDGARVRPVAAEKAKSQARGPLKPGSYACSAFIGTPPNGHMQPMPGIQILGGNAYVHSTGNSKGQFTYDTAEGLVVFRGGNMDGQAARYDQSPDGRASLHIYNERRSRTVIDCNGPK